MLVSQLCMILGKKGILQDVINVSLVAQTVKHLPTMWETQFQSLGREVPWRGKWHPTPVLLPGKIPWTEEPDRLQSMGSQGVGQD